MPPITVAKLAFNERADVKMWDHGVEFDRLPELLENRHVITRNRQGRAADLLLIGRDNSGRCIVVAIVPTADPLVWRPVTAGPASRAKKPRCGEGGASWMQPSAMSHCRNLLTRRNAS